MRVSAVGIGLLGGKENVSRPQWELDMKKEGERASWSVDGLHSDSQAGTWGSPGRQVGAEGGEV